MDFRQVVRSGYQNNGTTLKIFFSRKHYIINELKMYAAWICSKIHRGFHFGADVFTLIIASLIRLFIEICILFIRAFM